MKERADPPTDGAQSTRENSESVRRLLLYEVLLEEYDSHRHPSGGDDDAQPPLDEEEVRRIREDGEIFKDHCAKIKRRRRRAEFEAHFNGQLVARVCTLMYRAQRRAARQESARLHAHVEEHFKSSNDNEEEWRNKITEAVAEHLTGGAQVFVEGNGDREVATGVLSSTGDATADLGQSQSMTLNALTASSDNITVSVINNDAEPNGWEARSPEQIYASTLRSALCLSGGGIRSATFNLGILQGLARHGLLGKFDYLSTVSGGGFIGSWLTAWIHRRGTREVIAQLREPPRTPLQPDPQPVEHLRIFSNYLSPRPGLLSADTWTLVATMGRNLLLTWLVFVPFLMAALLVPRMWASFALQGTLPNDMAMALSLVIGFLAAAWSLVYIGTSLPSARREASDPANPSEGTQRRFIYLCLLPMVISAAALAKYWALLNDPPRPHEWHEFVLFTEAVMLSAWIITAVYRWIHAEFSGRFFWLRLLMATLFIVVSQFITGCLLWYGATEFLSGPAPHKRLYATFAVPMILLMLAVGCALIAGFSSRFTRDEDREWWGRAGAWTLIVVIGWVVVHLLVLFGPTGLEMFAQTARDLWQQGVSWSDLTFKNISQVAGVVIGVVSGVITLFGGFSAETPANAKEEQKMGASGKILRALTSLLAPIFLAFVVILLALATNWALTSKPGVWLGGSIHLQEGFLAALPALDHEGLILNTPLRYLLAVLVLLALISLTMGSLVNTNAFSLHFMWRTRIIRAYLGASRRRRRPHPFTGFDTYDNIRMFELRPQPGNVELPQIERPVDREPPRPGNVQPRKLFHVINIALNLAGGDKLAWQDRKAEPFTVTPLHAGSYWLGYRRSYRYGSVGDGISLGTSVAMSGAFVSPNMGYMMTSPIVRFLMTLFNVRFGWWLGNPGAVGDELDWLQRTIKWLSGTRLAHSRLGRWATGGEKYREVYPFEYRSPLLPVRPIVSEAFGLTNDRSRYVYLSDGGHFENLGLHEMVLRRCRFIVVSDASTDANYTFDSLAQSIRQIRVDLGIPIDITEMSIIPPSKDTKGKHCAVGKIRYSCVDRRAAPAAPPAPPTGPHDARYQEESELYPLMLKLYEMEKALHKSQRGMTDEDFDGILVYIKASMVGDEPRDVINYGQGNKDFPQEVITDQWFSEAQFESYRALGSHIIDAICGDSQGRLNFAAFDRRARAHNQMKVGVYRE